MNIVEWDDQTSNQSVIIKHKPNKIMDFISTTLTSAISNEKGEVDEQLVTNALTGLVTGEKDGIDLIKQKLLACSLSKGVVTMNEQPIGRILTNVIAKVLPNLR